MIEKQLNTLEVGLGGGMIMQYANRGVGQMMGYLLVTPEGKNVVIDGGRLGGPDAEHLYSQIKERGGKVDLWIITHAHDDHLGAIVYLMRKLEKLDIEIADLRFDFPSLEWFETSEGGKWHSLVAEFYELLKKHGVPHTALRAGDVIDIGGISIEVLRDASDYASYKIVNDTSAVLRVSYPCRDVLFLADLGRRAAAALAEVCPHEKLRCDIVQIAHHGHNAADKDFYAIVRPKIALFTSPEWLWYNDAGEGPGSGQWKIEETRGWMRELGVLVSCPHVHGDYKLI